MEAMQNLGAHDLQPYESGLFLPPMSIIKISEA